MMKKQPRSSIEPLGAVLQGLTETLGIKRKLQEYEAVIQWDAIVGDQIAQRTTAARIVKGVLFVKVKTSTWRNELNIRKKDIMTKINKTLGEEIVQDIKFQ